ncbi:hypothetical protein [Bordetella petrii]|uniref:hypothetical protein n=1 Tax=Bordetella petrii TaxID=94624 RepID=UPI001E5C902F|nr:hypothetical protein [Bordetella petrii]MCD0501732.1 hypothetical protein [Bordetella petrii]
MQAQNDGKINTDILYPLGFVIGKALSWVPDHYRKIDFPCPLYVNANTRYGLSRVPYRIAMVIGEPIHPDHIGLDQQGIAELLLSHWHQKQSEIDKLVGRFAVILMEDSGKIEIQTDAIGLRAVYFSRTSQGVVAGSHAKLVARAANGGEAVEFRQFYTLGYPGINTLYSRVYRLPPNNSLFLDTGELRRFFPTDHIPVTSLEESWDHAFSRAQQVVRGLTLRSERPVLVSLTGGLDSRSTLAATRGIWEKLDFFTYVSGQHPQHELDVLVASDLAAILGLRHQIIAYGHLTPDPKVMEAIKSNSFSIHQRNLSCAYLEHFGSHRYVHVRTNLMELARSNLFEHHGSHPAFPNGPNSIEKLAEYYCMVGKREPSKQIVEAFTRQFDEANTATALQFVSAWDLFFIEHRMGAWQAAVVTESDVAFDTIIAFNSREIIKKFIGVPQTIRSTSKYLQKKIRTLLPEISDIPINPRQYVRCR